MVGKYTKHQQYGTNGWYLETLHYAMVVWESHMPEKSQIVGQHENPQKVEKNWCIYILACCVCVCKVGSGESFEKRQYPPWPNFNWLGHATCYLENFT